MKDDFTIQLENHIMFPTEPTWVARFRSCEAHCGTFENKGKTELNIQYINSDEEGKGHAQDLVKNLLKFCEERGWKLVSSQPIHPAWEHIVQKFNLHAYA